MSGRTRRARPKPIVDAKQLRMSSALEAPKPILIPISKMSVAKPSLKKGGK